MHEIKNLKGFKIASLNINSELRFMLHNPEIDVFALKLAFQYKTLDHPEESHHISTDVNS